MVDALGDTGGSSDQGGGLLHRGLRSDLRAADVAVTALRIGVLGAAKIAPPAIVRPARAVDDAEVVAIVARDSDRARSFASKHHVPEVHDSYSALLDDPRIDAIYNPLPNGLHGRWTIAALEAGKHAVLWRREAVAHRTPLRQNR